MKTRTQISLVVVLSAVGAILGADLNPLRIQTSSGFGALVFAYLIVSASAVLLVALVTTMAKDTRLYQNKNFRYYAEVILVAISLPFISGVVRVEINDSSALFVIQFIALWFFILYLGEREKNRELQQKEQDVWDFFYSLESSATKKGD